MHKSTDLRTGSPDQDKPKNAETNKHKTFEELAEEFGHTKVEGKGDPKFPSVKK